MSETKNNRYNVQQNFVTAEARQLPAVARRMTPEETAALTNLTQTEIMPGKAQPIQMPDYDGTHTGHIRHNDDPVTNVKASILYSLTIMAITAFVIGALLILTGLCDGDIVLFLGAEIVGTGAVGISALIINRNQGLHHSATGIAHAENKTRERLGQQAISATSEIELARIDADKTVKLAELNVRRDLGQAYLKQLEGPK